MLAASAEDVAARKQVAIAGQQRIENPLLNSQTIARDLSPRKRCVGGFKIWEISP
jgi:hypothetical protein